MGTGIVYARPKYPTSSWWVHLSRTAFALAVRLEATRLRNQVSSAPAFTGVDAYYEDHRPKLGPNSLPANCAFDERQS